MNVLDRLSQMGFMFGTVFKTGERFYLKKLLFLFFGVACSLPLKSIMYIF